MAFLMTRACTSVMRGGSRGLVFPNADATVSIIMREAKEASVVIHVAFRILEIARMKLDDAIDLGIDPSANLMQICLIDGGPYHLRQSKEDFKSGNNRATQTLVWRTEWGPMPTKSIPLMPIKAKIIPGCLQFELPTSWRALMKGAK